MKNYLLYLFVALVIGAACTPESNQLGPVVDPALQIKPELNAARNKLRLTWNDLGKYYKDITYTVIVRNPLLLNQFDTLALNQKLNTLTAITVVPNTTLTGTVVARNGQSQVIQDEFTLKVGPPTAPDNRYVSLQDIAFERYLIDTQIDSDKTLNGLVLKEDVQHVSTLNLKKGPLSDVDYYPINLKGIEYFTGLTQLTVNTAFTDSLDLSQNKELAFLDCRGYDVPDFYQAKLAYLLVGSKPRLTQLFCGSSELSSLELSGCALLKIFSCSLSYLNDINTITCRDLEYMDVSYNNLTKLDVTANAKLWYLRCSGANSRKGLTSLDVSKNPDLRELYLQDQQINTPLSLCSNTKLTMCRTDRTPIPTIQVPFSIDDASSLSRSWSKEAKTVFVSCL